MSEQSQKTTGIRDARTLGIPKMLLLGIQHMFAMFGATILVPILTNVYFEGEGLSVQVTLICAGLGTLFFHLCSKMKVPAFLDCRCKKSNEIFASCCDRTNDYFNWSFTGRKCCY